MFLQSISINRSKACRLHANQTWTRRMQLQLDNLETLFLICILNSFQECSLLKLIIPGQQPISISIKCKWCRTKEDIQPRTVSAVAERKDLLQSECHIWCTILIAILIRTWSSTLTIRGPRRQSIKLKLRRRSSLAVSKSLKDKTKILRSNQTQDLIREVVLDLLTVSPNCNLWRSISRIQPLKLLTIAKPRSSQRMTSK